MEFIELKIKGRKENKGGETQMKKSILFGALITIICVLGIVGAVVVYHLGFRQRAEIEAVSMIRVFYDELQTQELLPGTTFDWGSISSGTHLLTLYVNNTGNGPVTLSFDYDRGRMPGDWVEYWDYTGTPLAQYETRTVTITLILPTYISAGTWEWDSWIRATPA